MRAGGYPHFVGVRWPVLPERRALSCYLSCVPTSVLTDFCLAHTHVLIHVDRHGSVICASCASHLRFV